MKAGYSGAEITRVLKIPKQTVTRHIKKGILKNSNTSRLNKIYVTRKDLSEYIRNMGLEITLKEVDRKCKQ